MDEFGTYRPEDIPLFAQKILDNQNFTIAYSEDSESSYVVSFAKAPKLGGFLPWGGSIEGLHLIAVRKRGAEFFALISKAHLAPHYLADKLNLNEVDSEVMARLLNGIRIAIGAIIEARVLGESDAR